MPPKRPRTAKNDDFSVFISNSGFQFPAGRAVGKLFQAVEPFTPQAEAKHRRQEPPVGKSPEIVQAKHRAAADAFQTAVIGDPERMLAPALNPYLSRDLRVCSQHVYPI